MGRRIMRRNSLNIIVSDELFSPVLLGAVFVLGGFSGFLIARFGTHDGRIASYLLDYFSAVGGAEGLRVNFLSVGWDIVRWPLIVMLLGMSRAALIAVPALIFLRALLLSHAITVFTVLFHLKGLLIALTVFGLSAFLVFPAIYAIGCDSMRFHGAGLFEKEKLPTLLCCVICVCTAAVLQWSMIPTAVIAVCHRFFTL